MLRSIYGQQDYFEHASLLSVGRCFDGVQSQYTAILRASTDGMLRPADLYHVNKRLVLYLLVFVLASACSTPKDGATALQKLRIENVGTVDIKGLTALFPGATADSPAALVEFGDVPAGKTTDYRSVPSGVYRYAAYEYTLDGSTVQQAVMDWVGESPMKGSNFTYRVRLDPAKVRGDQIELIAALLDSP
jgi:hypothetical protein